MLHVETIVYVHVYAGSICLILTGKLSHQLWILVTFVINCFQGYVLYISDLQRSVHEIHAGEKLEHSIRLEVAVRVIGVVIEGETWLSVTGYWWAQWV